MDQWTLVVIHGYSYAGIDDEEWLDTGHDTILDSTIDGLDIIVY